MDLVREFARDHSEAAFTELVRRHLNLVYSIARRSTDTDGDAQDVTQAVFVILARKAAGLRARTVLTGWLCETTRFTAACLQRTNARRHAREQEAYMQSTLTDTDTAGLWSRLAPHLEAGMAQLGERDRTLLALRFYENNSGPEAAALLGINEAAAHKRTARALEKLRKIFTQRGVALSAAAIAGSVSVNAVHAAPAGLALKISVVAPKGAAVTTSINGLIKGTMQTMTWMKVKVLAGIAATVLMTGGGIFFAFEYYESKQPPIDPIVFFRAAIASPPDVEFFVAGQRDLQPQETLAELIKLVGQKAASHESGDRGAMHYSSGARSGTNFYLLTIKDPKAPQHPSEGFVVGRDGSNAYEFSANAISYGYGSNSLVSGVETFSGLTRQLLDMGLGGIEPSSVVWNGNQFSASSILENSRYGRSEYGRLEISNNLPFRLTISRERDGPSEEMIEYTYPKPPALLGGFPSKMVFLDTTEDGLKPSLEIMLYSVRLAKRRLPVDYFIADKFKTAAILYTNIYQDAGLYISGRRGINGKIMGGMFAVTNINGKLKSTPTAPIKK